MTAPAPPAITARSDSIECICEGGSDASRWRWSVECSPGDPWIYWTIVAAVAAAAARSRRVGPRQRRRRTRTLGRHRRRARRRRARGRRRAVGRPDRRAPIPGGDDPAPVRWRRSSRARPPAHASRAGEIVVDVDVAATTAPRSLIPPGWLAVAIVEAVAVGRDRSATTSSSRPRASGSPATR